MTINHLTDNTDINIYFHMKNHYKKLNKVKSVIDTSAPKGFIKSTTTPPTSDRSWKTCSYEERHTKDCSRLPNQGTFKKHNCTSLDSKSNASPRSISTPPRPKTRRHPYEMPYRSQWKSRSQSVGLTSRKNVATNPYDNDAKKRKALRNKSCIHQIESEKTPAKEKAIATEEVPNDESNTSVKSGKTASSKSEKSILQSRAEEHEYLQFLLRITEDIIVNNFYTSEDLEKVFHNHIEANRDRLKMEKMEAQLGRLRKELHIPYKHIETVSKNEECYTNFFENKHNSEFAQQPEDCECATKRVLEVKNRDDKKINTATNSSLENCFQLNDSMFAGSSTILLNKHSLGRVTECTEPTLSMESVANLTKHASHTSISSFDTLVPPCFECPDVCTQVENNYLCEDQEPTEKTKIVDKEIPLTENEKMKSTEEKIIFDKLAITSLDEHTINDNSQNTNTDITKNSLDKDVNLVSNEQCLQYQSEEKGILNKKLYKISDISEDLPPLQTYHVKQDESLLLSNLEHHINKNVSKLCTFIPQHKENVHIANKATQDNNAIKFTFNRGTQIEVSQCNKECNTEKIMDECPISNDYVLINGPIYVLKTLLNAKENILMGENHITDKVRGESLPKKLLQKVSPPFKDLYTTDYDVKPLHSRESQYSKLLNSDYDLTPQRDNNMSEKYHHLLTDATTSVTNLSAATVAVSNLNPDTLLLTEKYSLNNRGDSKDLDGRTEKGDGESEKCHCDRKNGYSFSTNELSSDGQYEIKCYTMPKEVNQCVKLSGYSISSQAERDDQICDQMTELDISLTAYEIKSEVNDSDMQKSEVGTNGDMEHLARTFNTVEDKGHSETSYVNSDKLQNSTYTKNILGKRKLNHPS